MKKGFSLIEVVFAIVIISISLMTVPMLLKQSSKSDEYSIIQEAVLATSTKMGNILSYPWDGASYDATNKILRVLDVSSSGDSELARDTASLNSNYRKGHVVGNQRRRFFDFTSGKVFATGTGGISQYNSKSSTIGGSGAYDYKDSGMTMASSVFYISDSANYSQKNVTFTVNNTSITNSTNIKMIQITTTSPKLGQTLTLRTFACNIGQANLLHRYYP